MCSSSNCPTLSTAYPSERCLPGFVRFAPLRLTSFNLIPTLSLDKNRILPWLARLEILRSFSLHLLFLSPHPYLPLQHRPSTMATHVVTATTTSPTPSGNQFSVYGQPSPVNSATATPSNNSPTSPRQQYLPLNNRQLRPPKAPLYVPAALRPTERPQKHSPPTPPRSVHGSLDSLNDGEEQTVSSRRSTMDSTTSGGVSRLAENEWMRHEHLGQVTGLPTRDHWKVSILSPFSSSPFVVHDPGVGILIYPIGWREHASRCRTSRSITTNGVLATPLIVSEYN